MHVCFLCFRFCTFFGLPLVCSGGGVFFTIFVLSLNKLVHKPIGSTGATTCELALVSFYQKKKKKYFVILCGEMYINPFKFICVFLRKAAYILVQFDHFWCMVSQNMILQNQTHTATTRKSHLFMQNVFWTGIWTDLWLELWRLVKVTTLQSRGHTLWLTELQCLLLCLNLLRKLLNLAY